MRQRKAGFTLVELLSVVAIMVIVAVVAIPGTMTLLRSLKMMELDETAKEIYLTAQNRLTARKAAGTLSAVGGDESPANSGLYWIKSTDPKMAKLLPEGSLEAQTEDGTFVIWYNADTATVGEVYFTERGTIMPGLSVLQTMNYSDHYVPSRAVSEDSAEPGLTPKELRREKKIGYYNGEESGLGIGAGDEVALLPPLLEIINEDELIVKVTVPDHANYLNLGVRLKVTVEELDAEGNPVASQVLCDGKYYDGVTPTPGVVSAESTPTPGVWTGVLDSLSRTTDGAAMAPGSSNRVSFKSTCPGITPGANIRVTATLTADPALAVGGVYDNSKVYFSGSISEETNSLFESRQLVEDTSVDPAVTKDTVRVSWARHLQNLNTAYSTNGWYTFGPSGGVMPNGRLYIEQSDDIVWPSTAAEYQSINEWGNTLAAFNGNEYEIRELRGSNGLFSAALDVELKHIRIVNPNIVNSQMFDYVGALAGWVAGTSENLPAVVTDCRVYLSVPKETTVGGMVQVSEQIDQYSRYKISVAGAHSFVGGLIGTTRYVAVSDSFASLHTIEGSGTVGGLVGCLETKVDTSTGLKDMEHCYASSTQVTGTPTKAAGLIGDVANHANGAVISQCFAATNIAALRGAGTSGISGFANGLAISATDSYCAVTYNDAGGNPTGVQPDYGFAKGGTAANCAYLVTGATPLNSDSADQSAKLSFEELKTWKAGVFASVTDDVRMALTHPYKEELRGKAYPFPMIVETQDASHPTIPFYGSWTEMMNDDLLLAYYELYTDETYGFYAEGVNGGTAISTLNDTKAVKEDGYAILSVNAVSAGKLTFAYEKDGGTRGSGETSGSVSGLSLRSPVSGSTATYRYAYLIRPDWLNSAEAYSVSQAYTKLTCNGTQFWLIPEFARTAKNVTAPANPGDTEDMEVRTARQLAAVSQNNFWWSHCQLKQTRNIDFASYDSAYKDTALTFLLIGTNTEPFTTSYNAVNGWITGLDIEQSTVNYVGLFGYVGSTGRLTGITFLSDPEKKADGTYTDSRNITGRKYVGALVGWNEGTITNCAVAGFDISGESAMGGFVGKNEGTITQCAADNAHFAVKKQTGEIFSFTDNVNVGGWVAKDKNNKGCGGFVGENGGTIRYCYAVARMPDDSKNKKMGGFAGENKDGTIESAYCIAIGAKDTGNESGTVTRDYLEFFGGKQGTQQNCYSLGNNPIGTTKTYDDLKTLFSGTAPWKKMNQKADGITYHYSTELADPDDFYPFPTAVTRDGKPAHYGNWPLY